MVNDTVDKIKCVIVYGSKEKPPQNRTREKEELSLDKDLIRMVLEGGDLERKLRRSINLKSMKKGKKNQRAKKIKFKSLTKMKYVMNKT